MKSARTITLFSDTPSSNWSLSPFLVSILLHGGAFAVIMFVLLHTPKIFVSNVAPRYTVRILNLEETKPRIRYYPPKAVAQPAKMAKARSQSGGGASKPLAVPVKLAVQKPVPETLIQPDAPPKMLLTQKVPLPLVMIWTPEVVPVAKLVPPSPRQPTVAKVRPALETPNHERNLANLKISSSVFTTKMPSLPPSTTSPAAVSGPQHAEAVPETSSKGTAPPTPASVLSVSDVQLAEGTVTLPLANALPTPVPTGSLSPGGINDTGQTGRGSSAGNQSGPGPGQKVGEGNYPGAGNGSGAQGGGNNGQQIGGNAGSGNGPDGYQVTRITSPKDGQYGFFVVGSEVAEDYPETVGLWSGRLAYTVYLHVGLSKNWILQYSLPHLPGQKAANNIAGLSAPWPYYMERPHLAPGDSDSDAIMVHGFVSVAGRFEQLAVVFPPEFAQTKFVLHTLQQWQFRPATQGGKTTAVEVLLIIPDQSDSDD